VISEETMPTTRQPVLYVIDRAPRFRRQLVEVLRQDGGEAYGVESVEQALRLLDLLPQRFRVLLDLGAGTSEAVACLDGHPGVSEVAVLSSGAGNGHGRRRTQCATGRARRRRRRQPGESEPDGAFSSEGTVTHGARAKDAAIAAYPRAHGHAGRSQSTVSLDVHR